MYKFKDRMIAAILSVLLLINMIPFDVNAETQQEVPTINVGTSVMEVQSGNTFCVTVSGENLPDIMGLKCNLYYDSKVFTVNSVIQGELVPEDSMSGINYDDPGTISASVIHLDGIAQNGNFYTVDFQVKNDVPEGEYHFNLAVDEAYDTSMANVQIHKKISKIKVVKPPHQTKDLYLYGSLSRSDLRIGEQTQLTIGSYNLQGMACGNFVVNYDSDCLRLTNVEILDPLKAEGTLTSVNDKTKGLIQVSYIGIEEIIETGDLLRFDFESMKDEDSNTDISFEIEGCTDSELNPINVNKGIVSVGLVQNPIEVTEPKLSLIQDGNIINGILNVYAIVDGESGLAAADFTIKYDKNIMDCRRVTVDNSVSSNDGVIVTNEKIHDGEVKFSFVNTKGINENQRLVNLEFVVKNHEAESLPVSISATGSYDKNYDAVKLEYPAFHAIFEKSDLHMPAGSVRENIVPATCISKGSYESVVYCELCSKELSRSKENLSDSFDTTNHSGKTEIRNTKESTCTLKGYTGDTVCIACDAVIVKGEDIAEKPHTIVVDNAVEPSCTETGLTQGSHCSVCGTIITEQIVVPALGHKVDSKWLYDKTGHWYKCLNGCGKKIEFAEHALEWVVDKAATEDETGLKHQECECGYKTSINTKIEKLEHVHIGIVHHEAKEETCVEKGNIEYWVCSSKKCAGKFYIDEQCQTEIAVVEISANPEKHNIDKELKTDGINYWHQCLNKGCEAKWYRYKITYVENGGSLPDNVVVDYMRESETIKLALPERIGYTFDGWYTRPTFGSKYKVEEIPTGSTGNKTFYAKWILNTYNIKYNLFGGTFGSTYPISYNYENTVVLENPVRIGYAFDGWYDNADFSGEEVTEIAAGTLAENLTFYAKWNWDVTFEATMNEELLNIAGDEDGNKTIILPYDADSESYNSVNVNVLLSAKQNDAPIGIHIPAEDIVIELYKGEYKENSKPDKESKGYDFVITEAEAGNDTYTAVVKFVYDQKEERIEIPFKVATGKQPLPINKEVSWKGISNLEKGATFANIKEAVRNELLNGTPIKDNLDYNAGTVTFKNVRNEATALKSGNYTVVYEVAENTQYFEKAEATVQITYNTFSQAGVVYKALNQNEVINDGRIDDAAAIAAPIKSESRVINTTPYVSGVKIVPVFHTPWGDLDADELENHGYEVTVVANTVSGLKIMEADSGNAVTVEASAVPKKTETRKIKLTSTITLASDVDSELTDQPKVTITTTINNFKVFNGGSNAMKNIEYSFNEDDGVKKLENEGIKSYILEKNDVKRALALNVKTTDYAGNEFSSRDGSLKDKLTWTTSNKSVVSVSVDNKTGIPTLSVPKNAQGVAEITATAKDAGKYSVSFRIVVADTDVRVETTKLTLNSKASGATQAEGEWGIIYLYPNIMAMDMYGDETGSVSKPKVTVELTDQEGKELNEADPIFVLNDKSVAGEGKLLIRFNKAQASKKNYTVYLKVTQKFSEGASFSKDKIKVTISDQYSVPAISGKTSVNYNTALGKGYGYAEVLVTTAGTLSDLKLAAGSPFEIVNRQDAGTAKNGNLHLVKLAFRDDWTEEQLADYIPKPNKTKKVNVKFEAAYEGYREKALTGNISVTLTNIRPDFKLSAEQFNNPIFYKDQDMNLKQMRVYIDVPKGMTSVGTSIKLTESAEKFFEIVEGPEDIKEKSQIAVTVKTKTYGNASIQFAITNETFYKGEMLSKTLKTSGRSLTSESVTLYDRITNKKAANRFTFYQSQLGKESINLYADSQYLAEILKMNPNGTAKIEVQAADSAATKLLNKQALIYKEDGNGGICITATKDAFSNKSTSCKLKIFMSVSDGANTKNTKSQTITITFNPKAYDPSVTLKSSGSLNAANADAKVLVKPTMKYLPAGSRIENVRFTSSADAKNFEIFKGMLGESVTMEELLLREGGAFYISPADGAKIPSGKNTIGIAYDIRTVSGELITVNTSVAVNVVQTAKIKTSTSTVTLYNSVMGKEYGKSIVFTESVVNAPITVEVLNQEELSKAGISIQNDDAAPNEEVQYKVYVDKNLSRGQEKTYTVKTKVILHNSATKKGEPITYTVNFKVKLEK